MASLIESEFLLSDNLDHLPVIEEKLTLFGSPYETTTPGGYSPSADMPDGVRWSSIGLR